MVKKIQGRSGTPLVLFLSMEKVCAARLYNHAVGFLRHILWAFADWRVSQRVPLATVSLL